MAGQEGPSAKDLKACAKLLKQTKKEAKVLEGLALLAKSDHVTIFMDEGAALVPIAGLIDTSKLSDTVVARALEILARYLVTENASENYVAQGQTKKSSPCRGLDRFLKLLGSENADIVQGSLQCLGRLVAAASAVEDGPAVLAATSAQCTALLRLDAPPATRIEALTTLLCLLRAGSEPAPILDAVLGCCALETVPVEIQDAASKMLYQAAALLPCTEHLVASSETMGLLSALFEAASTRLVAYLPAKGEAPEDTESALATSEEGVRSALLLSVWAVAHQKSHSESVEAAGTTTDEASEGGALAEVAPDSPWAPPDTFFDALVSLLKCKRAGIVDTVLAVLPQLAQVHMQALADRDTANVLLDILNERFDPELLRLEAEAKDAQSMDEAKNEADQAYSAELMRAKEQPGEATDDAPERAVAALPLEFALHHMIRLMQEPSVKTESLKTAIIRAPTAAMRLMNLLLASRKAQSAPEAFEEWFLALVKDGVYHALLAALDEETVTLETAVRGINLLEHLVLWNAQATNRTALKDPVDWASLWLTAQSAARKHLASGTRCELVDPALRPAPRPDGNDPRWPSVAVAPQDSDDDILACIFRLVCAAVGADDASVAAAIAAAEEDAGEVSSPPPPRFFDDVLLKEDVRLATFTYEGLERAIDQDLAQVELAALDALRALAGLQGGRTAILAQLLAARREQSEQEGSEEKADPEADADAEESPRFLDHMAAPNFAIMQHICGSLAKVLYDKEQPDDAVLSAVGTLAALCRESRVQNAWEQPLDADLFCAAALRARILPCLTAFIECEHLQQGALDLAEHLALRGLRREEAWKTWEEPEVDAEGVPVLNEAGEPVLVTRGPGEDPNCGPNKNEWANLLDEASLDLHQGPRMKRVPTVSSQTAVAILARQPESPASVELVEQLIRAGADLEKAADTDGISPLMWAVANGNEGVARALLASGRTDVDAIDAQGRNVCMWAFAGGKLLPLLLEFNVDVNISAAADGSYPLHWISSGVSQDGFSSTLDDYGGWLEALLQSGAETDLVDSAGRSPLHYAVAHGQTAVALDLLRAGADPNVVDCDGNLALHVACQGARVELLNELLERGNKRPLSKGCFQDHGRGQSLAQRVAFRVDRALDAGLKELVHPKVICDHVVSVLDLICVRNTAGWSPLHVLIAGDVAPQVPELSMGPVLTTDEGSTKVEAWALRAEMLQALLSHSAVDGSALVREHMGAKGINALGSFLQQQIPDTVAPAALEMLKALLRMYGPSAGRALLAADDSGLAPLHYVCLRLPTVEVTRRVLQALNEAAEAWDVPDDLAVDPFVLLAPHRDANEASAELFGWFLEHAELFAAAFRARSPRVGVPDSLTGTPLTAATAAGDLTTVQILLGSEATDLDAKESATGRTALHLACLHGHTDVAIYLAVNGADEEITDGDKGEVALFFAVRGCKLVALEALVGSSEEPGILYGQLLAVNAKGDTPLLLAERLNMGPDGSAFDDLVRALLRVTPAENLEIEEEVKEKEDDEQKVQQRKKKDPQGATVDPMWAPLAFVTGQICADAAPGKHLHHCFSRGITYTQWIAAEEAAALAEQEKQEQSAAATKIQAIHRGRTQRKEALRKQANGDARDEDDKSSSKKKGKKSKKKEAEASSSAKKKKKKKNK